MDWLVRHLFTTLCLASFVLLMRVSGSSLPSNIPGKPTDLRVASVHDLTITLTWKRPTNMPLNTRLLYTVRYSAIGGRSGPSTSQPTESAQLSLFPETRYNIHVKAMRSDDHNKQSDWQSLTVDTKDFVPAKPTNLRKVQMRGSRVEVAWDEPLTTATGIHDNSTLKYKISFKKRGYLTKQLTANKRSYHLPLDWDSTYEIKVRAFKAFNARVFGSWSEILTFKSDPHAPTKPPTNVQVISRSLSSITISWGPIPEDGRNAVILGFMVYYRDQSADSWLQRDVKLAYSVDLTDLNTGKEFTVQVAGYNQIGLGKRSQSKLIIVGGQFLTTTQGITTEKSTAVKLASTTKKTTTTTTSAQAPATDIKQKTTETSKAVDVVASVSTEGSRYSTGAVVIQNPYEETTIPAAWASTSPVPFARRADEVTERGSPNNALTIGAPVAGVLFLLIILLAVFVWRRRRSHKRTLQNGEIPLHVNGPGQERSRDTVTRNAFSIRYEPPGDVSMTQGLLALSVEPHRSLPREGAEDSPLLGASSPDKCKLSVDLNTEQGKLADGRGESLYDSIGSPVEAECKNARRSESGECYVTRGQMAATGDKDPLEPAAQTRVPQCNGPVPADTSQQGDIYENMQDSAHLYDTLFSEGKDGPVYENTKDPSSPQEEDIRGKDDGYEPLGHCDKLLTK